jgi:hypothetical protein
MFVVPGFENHLGLAGHRGLAILINQTAVGLFIASILGGHPKPAMCGHLKTGHRKLA